MSLLLSLYFIPQIKFYPVTNGVTSIRTESKSVFKLNVFEGLSLYIEAMNEMLFHL